MTPSATPRAFLSRGTTRASDTHTIDGEQRPFAPLRRAIGEALALLFPVACAGCAIQGAELCRPCRIRSEPRPRLLELEGVSPLVIAHEFSGPIAGIIRAVKQHGRTRLIPQLASSASASLSYGLRYLRRGEQTRPLVLIPIPSSRRSRRQRGFILNERLLRGIGLRGDKRLRLIRQTHDQRSLGRRDRARNLAGAMRADESLAGREVILFDDVVTTGATLREARRAVTAAGGVVVLFIAVAATRSNSWQTTRDIPG